MPECKVPTDLHPDHCSVLKNGVKSTSEGGLFTVYLERDELLELCSQAAAWTWYA